MVGEAMCCTMTTALPKKSDGHLAILFYQEDSWLSQMYTPGGEPLDVLEGLWVGLLRDRGVLNGREEFEGWPTFSGLHFSLWNWGLY